MEELTAEGLEAIRQEVPGTHDVLVEFYGARHAIPSFHAALPRALSDTCGSCGRCVEFEPHYKQVCSSHPV